MSSLLDNFNKSINISNEEDISSDKEPLSLLSLKSDAIGLILSKFLTIHDVSKLDVAYCNYDKRSELLNILSNNPYITYDHITFDDTCKQVDNILIYIGTRKINISSISY